MTSEHTPTPEREAGEAEAPSADPEGEPDRSSALENALGRVDRALDALANAKGFAKPRHQVDLFAAAGELLDHDRGLAALYERASRFDDAGVFHAGPWEDPGRLQATLVGGCLVGEGQYPTIECLSELRVLSIAAKRSTHDNMSPEEARAFLRETVALNLDLLLPGGSTEMRRERTGVVERAHRILRFVVDELGLTGLRKDVVEEIGFRIAQRPIVTRPLERLIELAQQLGADESEGDATQQLDAFVRALDHPTDASRSAGTLGTYRQRVKDLDDGALLLESKAFAESLKNTGIGNPFHAVLLRRLAKRRHDLLAEAFGLDSYAQASLKRNEEFARQLIRVAILPSTASAIDGFVGMLARGLLSRDEVIGGLKRLVDLDLRPEVRNMIRARFPRDSGITANSVLVAAAISVLGKPLGIGQGNSPTCQAARALNLWSKHAPGYLLDVLATAARDGVVEMRFEGQQLRSNELMKTPSEAKPDVNLDPVSAILVPHLDRIYGEMLRRAHGRGIDAHKWVNPAMYGRWVPTGFCSALDVTGRVTEFRRMVRRFYASHHPAYNDGHALVYPNPVGIFVTDVHGNLLGPHAVSLLRIADSGDGALRAYFFNPNDEGRQNWGQGIEPTVSGHGEVPGESSLPLHHFVSRLYAFHYNPYEEGDAFAVPADVIDDVTELAKESWGRALPWTDL